MASRAVTARQMRALDSAARKQFNIPELILMEHAGLAVAKAVMAVLRKQRRRNGSVLVLAGSGANGGDGFVAARHLNNAGVPVQVILLADPGKLKGAAKTNLQIIRKLKVPVMTIRIPLAWNVWVKKRPRILMVVDAMLGIGASGPVREPFRTVIQWLNQSASPVIAVDLPSGLCADTGEPQGVTVEATTTVTCGLPKIGLQNSTGRAYAGRVIVADISLPRVLMESAG